MNQFEKQWQDYFRSEKSDLHVMPNDDKHKCSSECFCEPKCTYRDEVTGKGVWTHKSQEELCQ